jgi:hypothetical protein
VPESIKQIVARALRKDASERYGSAGQMILDLVVARRELRARPAPGIVTKEVPAVRPAAVADSTAPFRRLRSSAAAVTTEMSPPRKGPILLLLGASALLIAGAAVFTLRGCGRIRLLAPASAPSR